MMVIIGTKIKKAGLRKKQRMRKQRNKIIQNS